MPKVRTLLISGLAAASLTAGLVIPVTAADTKGTLAIVNGIPGQKVDVCLDGKELKSGLKYGGSVFKNIVPTGSRNLRVTKPDPRTCRGTLVAKQGFPLAGAGDLTIVVTKKAPRIVTFENGGEIPPWGHRMLTPSSPGVTPRSLPSTSDIAPGHPIRRVPIGPSIDPIWSKGQQTSGSSEPDDIWQLRATLPESPDTSP